MNAMSLAQKAEQPTKIRLSERVRNQQQRGKSWLRERSASEKRLILGAIGIAFLMGLYTLVEFGVTQFQAQRERLNEIETTIKSLSPLINQLHRLEEQKLSSLERFSKAVQQDTVWGHLDSLLRKNGRDKLNGKLQRMGDTNKSLGDTFIRHPFKVTFQRISQEDLAGFLKRLSSDEKRPAVISKISITSRGSSLNAEISLEIITRQE